MVIDTHFSEYLFKMLAVFKISKQNFKKFNYFLFFAGLCHFQHGGLRFGSLRSQQWLQSYATGTPMINGNFRFQNFRSRF